MIRRTRIAFAVGVLVLASACGSQGGTLVGPEDRPSFDAGGGPLVGGNVVENPDEDEGATTASAEPAAGDSTSLGGGPLVGGN
jgi:hypothetical protein